MILDKRAPDPRELLGGFATNFWEPISALTGSYTTICYDQVMKDFLVIGPGDTNNVRWTRNPFTWPLDGSNGGMRSTGLYGDRWQAVFRPVDGIMVAVANTGRIIFTLRIMEHRWGVFLSHNNLVGINLTGICVGETSGSNFVAIEGGSSSQGRIYSSLHGSIWTLRLTGTHAQKWTAVCYGGGRYVAIADGTTNSATRIAHSIDGVTWTEISDSNAFDSFTPSAIAYSPKLHNYVVVGNSPLNRRFITIGGNCDSFTLNNTGLDSRLAVPWSSITWINELGIYLAMASSNSANCIATSRDGINWTIRNNPVTGTRDWRGILWSPLHRTAIAIAGNTGGGGMSILGGGLGF